MMLLELFSFKGKFSEPQFWKFGIGLPSLMVAFLTATILYISEIVEMDAFGGDIEGILLFSALIIFSWIYLVSIIKRWRGLEYRLIWLYIMLVPLCFILIFIVLEITAVISMRDFEILAFATDSLENPEKFLAFYLGLGLFTGLSKGKKDTKQVDVSYIDTSTKGDSDASKLIVSELINRKISQDKSWILTGTNGEYIGCEFVYDADIYFGNNSKKCTIVFDRLKFPEMEMFKLTKPLNSNAPKLFYKKENDDEIDWQEKLIKNGIFDVGNNQTFQIISTS